MKKRNCRKNEEEKRMHERAVKIRKMTDYQLCMYINALKDDAYEEGFRDGKNQAEPTTGNKVSEFIQHLDVMSGTGNGIGKSTVYKLRKFAEKEGYLESRKEVGA